MFQKAYEVYSLFWALRLNLISVAEMQKPETNLTLTSR